jgi:hypothetical protein
MQQQQSQPTPPPQPQPQPVTPPVVGGAPVGYMSEVTPGYAPGWDQPTYQPSASGTAWAGARAELSGLHPLVLAPVVHLCLCPSDGTP